MGDITTFTNFSQTWLASYENTPEEENLKSLCLYNDKIIFPLHDSLNDAFITGMREKYGIKLQHLKNTFISLEQVTGGAGLVNTVFDYSIKPSKLLGEAYDNEATMAFLQTFADKEGLTFVELESKLKKDNYMAYDYYKEVYYHKLSVLSSLLIYNKLNSIMPCSLTSFSAAESVVTNSYIKYNFQNQSEIQADTLVSEIKCLIPSLSSLNWNEIFELRQDKRVQAFRTWINDNKETILNKGIETIMLEELWKVFKELRPNVVSNSVKGILGNVPLPIPINPLGIASSIYDISKNVKFKKDYSWLLFIYDTKNRVSNSC